MKRITVVRSSWWPAKRATASRERPRTGCGNGRRTWRARPGRVELRYQNRLPRAKAALFPTLESRRSRSMSRRLRYHVAVSLAGFIAGPNGEYDWIVMDPAIDSAALFKEFDTAVMGRKTYVVLTAQGGHGGMPGLEVVVFSRTLRPAAYPGVRIVNDDPREVVAALKAKPGRDIWLYGGGDFFRSLLNAGLVDTVEVAVVPVLPGGGVPV